MERVCWLGGTTPDRPLSDMRVDAFSSATVQYMILNSRGESWPDEPVGSRSMAALSFPSV
jgi:hypothetical protein